MNIFRNFGLLIAIFWVAAMVLSPVVTAAAGQETNPGNSAAPPGRGTDRMPQIQGPGSGPEGNAGPAPWNNQTTLQEASHNGGTGRPGNITAQPSLRVWDAGNMTAFGNRTMYDPDPDNMTAPPLPPYWNADNQTLNATIAWHGPGFGNETAPEFPQPQNVHDGTPSDNGVWDGPAGNDTATALILQDHPVNQNQQRSGNDLIAEFFSWLKTHTGV